VTTARVSIRQQIAEWLRADDALIDVQVEEGWAGELSERETIFFGGTTGTMSIPVFTGQPSTDTPFSYDDEFTITVYVWAATPGQTFAEADERGAELWQALERVMRVHEFVDGDGWVLVDAQIGQVVSDIGPTAEGFAQVIEADINVLARISGPAV